MKGIAVDSKKTEDVKSFPKLLCPSDIQKILGLKGYYRRFMEGFSSIASPLNALTQNKVKVLWLEMCEKNFQGVCTIWIKTKNETKSIKF